MTSHPSDHPVVLPSPRERCELHGLYLRPDGTCSRCDAVATTAATAKLLRGFAIALVAIVALAVTVRAYGAYDEWRARAAATKRAKVAAVTTASQSRVVMYTMAGCGACKAEKAWMSAHAVPYVERRVDTDAEARKELHSLTGRGMLPTTVIDEDVLVGFNPGGLERSLRQHRAL